MNKKLNSILFLALFLGFCGGTIAQKSVKLGHFNSADLIKKMPEGDSAQAEITRYVTELQGEMESMQKEYEKLVTDYQSKEAELSDFLKANKQKEIQSVMERMQLFQQNAEADIMKKREDVMTTLYAKIKTVVAEIAKDGKYDYILENQGVMWYANDSDDILPLILKKMNLQ